MSYTKFDLIDKKVKLLINTLNNRSDTGTEAGIQPHKKSFILIAVLSVGGTEKE